MEWDGAAAEQWVTVLSLILYKHHYTTTLLWICLFSLLPSHNNTTELQAADSHIIKCHTPLRYTALHNDETSAPYNTAHQPHLPKAHNSAILKQHQNITLLYYKLDYICDPCWYNESECARSNFELQAKEVKNDSFGRIWGFHKN